jgi:esterase/lipase
MLKLIRKLFATFGLLLACAGYGSLATAADIGVVLLHGKGGTPSGNIQSLAIGLLNRGYLVSTPTMPWSQKRIYDATFEESMLEIDREVDSLRAKGVKTIVVAGQSLGANAALGFAATRTSVHGIVSISAGHSPESPAFINRFSQEVERARKLIASGNGKDKQTFPDINVGKTSEVKATAENYLSWFDPQGAAVMPKSVLSFKESIPLLFITGNSDRLAPSKEYIFDKAPPHPKSKFVIVSADHFSAPSASIEEVSTWLESLRKE